jgi:hypothetical protein
VDRRILAIVFANVPRNDPSKETLNEEKEKKWSSIFAA